MSRATASRSQSTLSPYSTLPWSSLDRPEAPPRPWRRAAASAKAEAARSSSPGLELARDLAGGVPLRLFPERDSGRDFVWVLAMTSSYRDLPSAFLRFRAA